MHDGNFVYISADLHAHWITLISSIITLRYQHWVCFAQQCMVVAYLFNIIFCRTAGYTCTVHECFILCQCAYVCAIYLQASKQIGTCLFTSAVITVQNQILTKHFCGSIFVCLCASFFPSFFSFSLFE